MTPFYLTFFHYYVIISYFFFIKIPVYFTSFFFSVLFIMTSFYFTSFYHDIFLFHIFFFPYFDVLSFEELLQLRLFISRWCIKIEYTSIFLIQTEMYEWVLYERVERWLR